MPRLAGRPTTRQGVTPSAGTAPCLPTSQDVWNQDRFQQNLDLARQSAPRHKTKLCTDCGLNPKRRGHPVFCTECWLRRQPIEVQAAECARRAARVPEAEWRERVPSDQWPEGRRWCAGCQTMRMLQDFKEGATRCVPCASTAAHRTRIKRVYDFEGVDYEQLLALQDNRCAICGGRFISKRPNIDHDHRSGQVRGLLCDSCNNELLGSAASHGDVSSEGALKVLLAAIYYLRNPPARGDWKREWADDPPPF